MRAFKRVLVATVFSGSRRDKSLRGRTVLITAGPTREHLDPVRYMTNGSSGRVGAALAKAAAARNARVVVVSGPTDVTYPAGVEVVRVTSGLEMYKEALRRAKRAEVIIGAAAVSDWRFAKSSSRKIKRKPGALRLTLIPNPDIIKALASRRPAGQVVVGFALETHAPLRYARKKLVEKGLDAIVVNGPATLSGSSIDATVVTRGGAARPLGVLTKRAAAAKILDIVEELLGK